MSSASLAPQPYASIVIIGRGVPPLWHYEKWLSIVSALDPLVHATGESAAVRTVQGERDKTTQLRFGKIGWNARSHRKWTHDSPDTKAASSAWTFLLGEVWIPGWTVCIRERRDPKLFVSFEQPSILTRLKPGQFNQFFHIAMPMPFFQDHFAIVDNALQQIRQVVDSTGCFMQVHPWHSQLESIQHTINNQLHYIGMEHDIVHDICRTPGKWTKYDSQAIIAKPTSRSP
jgi:hypothetical protein